MKIYNSLFLQFSIGGILGNFLFQYFNNQIWSVAIERIYFLVTSMFLFWVIAWVISLLRKGNENE